MKPGNYFLSIYQGAVLDITINWRDKNGGLVDLSGSHARLQIRRLAGDPVILEDWSDGPGGGLILGKGTIRILVPSAITSVMAWGKGAYELVVVKNGMPMPLLIGDAQVLPRVMR